MSKAVVHWAQPWRCLPLGTSPHHPVTPSAVEGRAQSRGERRRGASAAGRVAGSNSFGPDRVPQSHTQPVSHQ